VEHRRAYQLVRCKETGNKNDTIWNFKLYMTPYNDKKFKKEKVCVLPAAVV